MGSKRWRREMVGRLRSYFACRERSEEEEESDSENEESKQTGRKKKTKRHQKKSSQRLNRQIQTVDQSENQTPPGTIRLGVLNVRSMEKKTDDIKRVIEDNKLDALLTTETWLNRDNAVTVLRKASPEGFRFHSRVRADNEDGRRGGGVAIQFSEELQGEPKSSDSSDKKIKTKTFEFVDTKLKHDDWDKPVGIMSLYRPPDQDKKEFQKEFKSVLDEVSNDHSSIIVTGDFNIHVNEESISDTKKFNKFLDANNLTQHVEEPTHQRGNTLDLVISRNVEISGLSVQDDGVSDHYTVYFNAKPKDTREKIEENENKEQEWFKKSEE